MDNLVKAMIINLIRQGNGVLGTIEEVDSIREKEKRARGAAGHRDAAATLLNAYPEFHNELIEHPEFLELRKNLRPLGV